MYIRRHGNGPRTFLGLHGWSGDHRTFDPLIAGMPGDASFHAVDLPGCGHSEDPSKWTLDAICGSVVEMALSIPAPFTLIGNCSGALLGMLAAQQMQGRVERMVLIDVFAEFPWYFQIFLMPLLGPVAYYSTFANPLGRWLANSSLRKRRASETNLTRGFSGARHQSTYRYLQLFTAYPAPESFAGLEMPIDLICGENTFAAAARSVSRWQSVWPRAQARRIAGAGHLPILEATSCVREILFQKGSVSTECLVPSPIIAG